MSRAARSLNVGIPVVGLYCAIVNVVRFIARNINDTYIVIQASLMQNALRLQKTVNNNRSQR